MTPDKYEREHRYPLEERVKGIETNVREIKGMVAGMYDKLGELADTADAVYRTVSYHTDESIHVPDDEWDFLDEEE